MPPIGLLLGRVDFSNLFINLSGQPYASLAEARAAGAPTINYGVFLNSVIDFLIVAIAIFLLVRSINRLTRERERAPEAPTTKECPFCFSSHPYESHALSRVHLCFASGLTTPVSRPLMPLTGIGMHRPVSYPRHGLNGSLATGEHRISCTRPRIAHLHHFVDPCLVGGYESCQGLPHVPSRPA